MPKKLLIWALLAAAVVSPSYAQQPAKLSAMSLEDLMNIEVTSVSKTEQKLSQAASAIYVITQEDIQRSGATNIPDLLRMVPGMDVAQINANTWAISARGFNGRYANNFVVLLDGRSVYLSSFGGVYWDVFDLPLEDIDRIEVIRGPGGSIWGTNAVNGVVNIITKKASETKRGMVVAGGGNLDQGFGTLQYGGSAGKTTDYRVYAKYFNEAALPAVAVGGGSDQWNILRGGFRADSVVSSKDKLMFQGSFYDGRENQAEPFLASLTSTKLQLVGEGYNLAGGFIQGVWDHEFSTRSESVLEVSYDRYHRDDVFSEGLGTINLDFQHHYRWGRQSLLSGISYYDSASTTQGTLAVTLNPPNLTTQLFGAFVQDEIAVAPDRIYLTIGARLEHDYYNGFGWMPAVRAAWMVSKHNTLWAAVSRALNAPSLSKTTPRVNYGGIPGPNGVLLVPVLFGNPDLQNETLFDYELGYRNTLSSNLSVDIAAYYNQYSRLNTLEPGTAFFETQPAPAHLVLPTIYENLMHGEAHGIEGFANWKLSGRWTLSPGYAFEQIHMHLEPSSRDTTSTAVAEESTPVNSAQFRSYFALYRGISWDTSAYFVGRLASASVPSYTRLDTGITWQAGERLSLSVFGQNLLNNERLEYVDSKGGTASTLMKRGAYAKIRWIF